MHFCHHIVPLFVLCGTYFPLVLGGMVNNFTECIKEGNYMLLDMPIRCLDSKTGKLFFGDVKQIYMQSKMFETVLKSADDQNTQESKNHNGFTCRTGFSEDWSFEHKNLGTSRWPGVLCESTQPSHIGHCVSFCTHCSKRFSRHVAAYNFGPGCRCYSATQARQIQLTGTEWDFCTISKAKDNAENSGEASKQKAFNQTVSQNGTAFHTANCPVKTLYARTCWAESARQRCIKYPPQKAYDLVMAALPNQEKMYYLYLDCLQQPPATHLRRTDEK